LEVREVDIFKGHLGRNFCDVREVENFGEVRRFGRIGRAEESAGSSHR
jgi:hypothetical protein